jgi:hypothetical protein
MRGGFSLSRAPYQVVTFDTWGRTSGLFSQALCVIFETLLQWRLLLETASLHDALLSQIW